MKKRVRYVAISPDNYAGRNYVFSSSIASSETSVVGANSRFPKHLSLQQIPHQATKYLQLQSNETADTYVIERFAIPVQTIPRPDGGIMVSNMNAVSPSELLLILCKFAALILLISFAVMAFFDFVIGSIVGIPAFVVLLWASRQFKASEESDVL